METLEKKLGYTFRDPSLLRAALYHSSYANEHRGARISSNERLEFLGDAVLGFVTAEHLYKTHPDLPEGDLTRMRAALVCEESLHEVAQALGLGDHLCLGKGEEQGGGRQRPSILADATESVFAAVYLDGGMEVARKFILPFITEGKHAEADYKTRLQEIVQQNPEERLSYVVESESGPDHDKKFEVEVLLNGKPCGKGSGSSKKRAEQSAAAAAIDALFPGEL